MWPYPEGHSCETCKRVFCSVMGREKHERAAHPPNNSCPICQKKFYETLEVLHHMEAHLPVICSYPRCGVLITTKLELLYHKAYKHLQIAPPMRSGDLKPSVNHESSRRAAAISGPVRVENSPLCTPKRRYPLESPIVSRPTDVDFRGQRTPTLSGRSAETSLLTPALSTLRLGISPLNSHFESCLEEDELMVTALDITPQTFHTPSHQ